jgi:flagellar hook-length control protein FliK
MSSDIFFTQLVPQSFSSGSSFDSVSNSAAGKQLGSTHGNDHLVGSHDSFGNTLNRMSDTDATSNAATHSAGNRIKAQEQEQTPGPTDAAEDGSPSSPGSNNLLGVSHDQAPTGDAAGLDPEETVELDSLTAILEKLENVLMLSHQSGQTPDPGAYGDTQPTGSGSGEAALEKLEVLVKQLQTGSQNKAAGEFSDMTELLNRISTEDAQKLVKTAEVAKLLQNLTALLPNHMGKGAHQSQIMQPGVQSQAVTPVAGEKLAAETTPSSPMPNASADKILQQSASQGLSWENNAQEKTAHERAAANAVPKPAGSGTTAGVQTAVNEQAAASLPDNSQIKTSQTGLKEIMIRSPEGVANPNPAGPVIQTGSPSVQSDGILQNAKTVNLSTQGSEAEATISKLLNAESGNKEEGFSFSSQQQNEMRTVETQNIAKEAETVQKEFRARTLDQIVQKAALHLKSGQNEVQINLKPDFLGQIRMQIITDSQQVTVRIIAEYPMVKEMIESNAHQLRNELQSYGLEIDELEVSVSQNSDQHVADQNKAGGLKGKKSSASNPGGEDGAIETALTASSPSDSNDDGARTRIDFFA